MSFLRNVPKNQLNQSVLCICFRRCVWQNPNHIFIGIEYRPSYRKLHHTSYLAKRASDYYKALGISRRATAQEIKYAYYELSKKYHPDKNKGNLASERFREIKEAYEVLGNQGKKRKYDRVVFSSSAAKTERTGNEIVIQNTDAFSRHMARYSTPMGERPTAQAMDSSLSDRSSAMFKERQQWYSQESEFDHEIRNRGISSNNMLILFGIAFFGAIAIFIRSSNERRYEEILRKNKNVNSK